MTATRAAPTRRRSANGTWSRASALTGCCRPRHGGGVLCLAPTHAQLRANAVTRLRRDVDGDGSQLARELETVDGLRCTPSFWC
jgi:hypothetical protein